MLIDGHLDLAYNAAANGRDLTLPLGVLRSQGHKDALVTLPELKTGGIDIVFGTIFIRPTYETPEEARALGLEQLELYECWEDQGHIRILRRAGDLKPYISGSEPLPVGVVLVMEGADPLVTPDDLASWYGRGLRLLGPAWHQTRYSGGTGAPGPLTDLGRELMQAMREMGVVLDVAHLADESFWEALELGPDRVVSSHGNARALVPTDRHLTDDMILALSERDGVIGLVMVNPFLNAAGPDGSPKEETTLTHVAQHAEHVAGLIGWDKVAVGTDWDGGFGVPDIPAGLMRGADFAKLGEAVPEAARAGFLGGNWLRFLQRTLPA